MKFFDEIFDEVKKAVECEDYAAGWKKEAAAHYSNAKTLIKSSKMIDPTAADVDPKTLIDQIKTTLSEPAAEAAPETPSQETKIPFDDLDREEQSEPVYHELPQTPSKE